MSDSETIYDVPRLLQMSRAELDDLFSARDPGSIPDGKGKGTAIVAPGSELNVVLAHLIRILWWQGKIFDARAGRLRNRILALSIGAIVAKVYPGTSWLDGKPCIVLDYSETSFVAKRIRDEIRQVQPGLYLGKVYWGKTRLIDFALELAAAR